MLAIYREYKSMSQQRKRWYRQAMLRRVTDYIGLIIILLLMSIELQ